MSERNRIRRRWGIVNPINSASESIMPMAVCAQAGPPDCRKEHRGDCGQAQGNKASPSHNPPSITGNSTPPSPTP